MVLRIVAFAAGAFIAAATLGSAVRVVVTPRAIPSLITRRVFLTLRHLFKLMMGRSEYERRDRLMAKYAPVALLSLLVTWLVLEIIGFGLMFWALDSTSLRESFVLSGSSLTTLGFARRPDVIASALSVVEAMIGLIVLALLISYLPSIYAAFSRREQMVVTLEVQAGYPPSAVEMLDRIHALGFTGRLTQMWRDWEEWFTFIEETHTSFPALAFFRSQQPYHSWVTAAGVILDAAALSVSTLQRPRDPEAELCIRAGYVALRRIAAFSRIPFDPDPRPDDPISIERSEFDDFYERMSAAGIPLKEREQAWRDFAGWRVNYDTVLIELCALVMAPPAPWSSDRLAKMGRRPGPADHTVMRRKNKVRASGEQRS